MLRYKGTLSKNPSLRFRFPDRRNLLEATELVETETCWLKLSEISLQTFQKQSYEFLPCSCSALGRITKCLRLGSLDLIVICDFKTLKEAFSSNAFMGRPDDLPVELSKETLRTKAFLGMPWKEQRRFSLHMLRDLGFGKTKMEAHMKEEILELLDRLNEYSGKTVKMSDLIAPSVSNNIASLVFGKRLKYNDPERKKLDNLLSQAGRLMLVNDWMLFFPWIKAVVKFLGIGYSDKIAGVFKEVKKYVGNEVRKHEETLDPNNARDFIDSYVLEIKKRSDDPDSTFKKEVLIDLARLFFGAGSETVRITLDWLFLMCVHRPELQKRIHSEIDEILGRDGFPTGQERLAMPYTEAFIMEVMRWISIVPLNIMRYTLEDTELNGYFIPKHTRVLAVLYATNNDREVWGADVYDFKPERFLSQDQKKIIRPEHFVPFSIGKRQCPGKPLAEVEVFLYFVAILQKFEFALPPGKEVDFEGILGIGMQPKRQDICVNKRH